MFFPKPLTNWPTGGEIWSICQMMITSLSWVLMHTVNIIILFSWIYHYNKKYGLSSSPVSLSGAMSSCSTVWLPVVIAMKNGLENISWDNSRYLASVTFKVQHVNMKSCWANIRCRVHFRSYMQMCMNCFSKIIFTLFRCCLHIMTILWMESVLQLMIMLCIILQWYMHTLSELCPYHWNSIYRSILNGYLSQYILLKCDHNKTGIYLLSI